MSIRSALCIIAGVFVIALLSVPGLFDDLFALFFIGIVPNTRYTIPSQIMFAVYALLIVLGIWYILGQSNLLLDTKKQELAGRKKARAAVYKKVRYVPAKKQPTRTKKHQRRTAEV